MVESLTLEPLTLEPLTLESLEPLKPLQVRVPATSANLGSGFDCLGVALDIWLEVSLEPAPYDQFLYHGQGFIADNPDNLIHHAFKKVFSQLGKPAPSVRLTVHNPIPLARGLGSSSAALVAGLALADAFLDFPLGKDKVFQLAAELEGHPDNVAPAILGQFTTSVKRDDGSYLSRSLPVPASWRWLVAIPDFELSTEQARAVLPLDYPREAVIFNASRTALWTLAIAQQDSSLLAVACQDKVHQPYRQDLVPNLWQTKQALLEAGAVACYLSGAGPTLAAVVCDEALEPACQKIAANFGKVKIVAVADGYYYF